MAECSGWSVLNPLCHAESAAQAVVGSAVENVANAVLEATGKAITSLGTVGEFNVEWDSPLAKAMLVAADNLSRRLGHDSTKVSGAPERNRTAT